MRTSMTIIGALFLKNKYGNDISDYAFITRKPKATLGQKAGPLFLSQEGLNVMGVSLQKKILFATWLELISCSKGAVVSLWHFNQPPTWLGIADFTVNVFVFRVVSGPRRAWGESKHFMSSLHLKASPTWELWLYYTDRLQVTLNLYPAVPRTPALEGSQIILHRNSSLIAACKMCYK